MRDLYNIAVCDDDRAFCRLMKEKILLHWKNNVNVFLFYSGEELIQSKQKFDCIFLDIEMIDLNGIEVASHIRSYDLDTHIVIVSGFPKYKNVAYRLHVFDYLDKPIKDSELYRTLDDLSALLNREKKKEYASFQTDKGTIKLNVEDILYFEYKDRKISLYAKDGNEYCFYDTIQKLEERFQPYHFVCPHKAYLVNPNFILRVQTNELMMENQARIPISKLRYKQVKACYLEMVSREMDHE